MIVKNWPVLAYRTRGLQHAQAGKLRHCTFLLLSSVLAATLFASTARAETACQKKARKIMTAHLAQIEKVDSAFAAKREKLISKYVRKLSDENKAAEFREIAARTVARNNPPKLPAEASHKLVVGLKALTELDEGHEQCDRLLTLSRYSKQIKEGFAAELEELHAELENRIDIESIEPGSGLAVIAAYSGGYAGRIYINRRGAVTGNVRIGPLKDEQYFRVMELPEGDYEWVKVSLGDGGSRNYYYDLNDDDLSFRVVAGKLNYTGVFDFKVVGDLAYTAIRDRSSITMQILEDRYPELLAQYEVVNGLVPEDTFMDFYREEKGQAEEP